MLGARPGRDDRGHHLRHPHRGPRAAPGDRAARARGPADARTAPVEPLDEHNRTLLENVHPPDWINPEPAARYHLVVVGAGTAGWCRPRAPRGSAPGWPCRAPPDGRRLPERRLRALEGGDPRRPRLAGGARGARGRFGGPAVRRDAGDFGAAMERMRRLRAGISDHDGARRFRGSASTSSWATARFVAPDDGRGRTASACASAAP